MLTSETCGPLEHAPCKHKRKRKISFPQRSLQSEGDDDPILGISQYGTRADLVFKVVCLTPVDKLAVTVQSNHLSICQASEKVFSDINDV